MPKVIIVGAGLVGSLNACFFAKRGWNVDVYEFRPDIRRMEHVPGRSINLALSVRGKAALDFVGLQDYIVDQGVPMFARLVHEKDGVTQQRLPYGKPGQHILSINRRHLNEVMITKAEECDNVKFFFEHKLSHLDVSKQELVVTNLRSNERFTVGHDAALICACDGAYSAVRRSLMKVRFSTYAPVPRFNYSQEYIPHGYIELNILPTADDQFAIEPNVFHLWPRGNFCLIALANKDKTFTVTLFAPFDVFETKLNSEGGVLQFFENNFPDALKLIGASMVVQTFAQVRTGSLVSVKCSPHHFGSKVVLLGDAAHAMVPFYGQGMNCGFEDCLVLNEVLDKHPDRADKALKAYSKQRCPDAHAINDLAMYNYSELRDLVNSPVFKLRKKFDALMHVLVGDTWTPLYSMVTFSRIRYHQVIERRKWQDKILWRTTKLIGFMAACAIVAVTIWQKTR